LELELSPGDAYGFVLGFGRHFMSGSGVESDNDTAFILGGRYDIFENTRLTASVTRKIRFPSLKQLYDVEYGNPDLGTEKTRQYEVGLSQQLPSDTSFSISAYYSEVEDYIEKIDDNPYANIEEYLFKGMDISVESRYIENLALRAGYSYLDSEDRSPGADRQELQYRPKHKYILEGTYTFNSGLMLHGNVTHVTDQYFYAENTSPMLKRKLNDYTVANAKISRRLLDDQLILYVRAENIFDADYEQSYDLPQAGRSVYGGIEIKF
jgi:outer membrane cobalamin receptor